MDGPDYKNYSLDELVDAISNISREKYPERVKIIEEEISKRRSGKSDITNSSSTTDKPKINISSSNHSSKHSFFGVDYDIQDGFYRSSLIVILLIFIILNITIFGVSMSALPVIAFSLQIFLLCFIVFRIRYNVILLQIWSWLLIIGGFAGLTASCATWVNRSLGGDLDAHTLTQSYMFDSIYRFIIGILYFSYLKKNVFKRKIADN